MRLQMETDYYRTLGVSKAAADADIKKAYRKMALRWHPSRNPLNEEEAKAKFKELSDAYQVLSDKHRRQLYDSHIRDGLVNGAYPEFDFDGVAPQYVNFKLRDPYAVFTELVDDKDFKFTIFDPHMFENSFPGFPSSDSRQQPPRPSSKEGLTSMSGSVFSGPTDDGFLSVTTARRCISGRNITKTTVVENDTETITVEEDGFLKSKTVNGRLQ